MPDTQTPTAWSPRGTFVPIVFRGGYDPLSLAGEGIMHVPQADLYDASPNEFPNNGQWDRPHGIAFSGVIRLPRRTSAHPGFMMPTAPGPTMLFRAPPIFSVQTRPIPAVGV